jgi:hypothetical protein
MRYRAVLRRWAFRPYLVSDNIAELIESAGKALVVHAILVGSGGAMETAKGLDTILTQFPASVRVVVWINEFFGPVAIDGTPVEDSKFFDDNRDRLGQHRPPSPTEPSDDRVELGADA